jgi:chromosome segregation ATPase
MQANAKISDDVIKEQEKKLEEVYRYNQELGETIKELKDLEVNTESARNIDLNKQLAECGNTIASLKNEIRSLTTIKADYEKYKGQMAQADIFRNELVKARDENKKIVTKYESEIEQLKKRIDLLITPTKKKKTTTKVKAEVVEEIKVVEPQVPTETLTSDGGSF